MFEELVMCSDAPKPINHGVDLKGQDRAYTSLPVCAIKLLGIPYTELDFSNARRCSMNHGKGAGFSVICSRKCSP